MSTELHPIETANHLATFRDHLRARGIGSELLDALVGALGVAVVNGRCEFEADRTPAEDTDGEHADSDECEELRRQILEDIRENGMPPVPDWATDDATEEPTMNVGEVHIHNDATEHAQRPDTVPPHAVPVTCWVARPRPSSTYLRVYLPDGESALGYFEAEAVEHGLPLPPTLPLMERVYMDHERQSVEGEDPKCSYCGTAWPCDTIQLADRVDPVANGEAVPAPGGDAT